MKILLLSVGDCGGGNSPPLGLGIIAAITLGMGVEIQILDTSVIPDDTSIIAAIDGYNCAFDMIGLSVLTDLTRPAITIRDACSRVWPGRLIFAGGPGATHNCESLLSLGFDTLFFGESEDSYAEWLDEILRGHPPRTGKITQRNPTNLDTCVAPDYTRFPLNAYELISLDLSRGCPNCCGFCDTPNDWPGYRQKSAEKMAGDLTEIVNKYGNTIFFTDPTFNPDVDSLMTKCHVIQPFNIEFSSFLQAQGVDGYTADALKRAGCNFVFLGVESFVPETLERLGKRAVSQNATEAIHALHAAGVLIAIGFMLLGPPFQTKEEFDLDLERLELMAPKLKVVNFSPLAINCRSGIHRQADELGITLDPHDSGNWHYKNNTEGERLAWRERAINVAKQANPNLILRY